jgi:multicomponent Na+:H+ antiporter subunit D
MWLAEHPLARYEKAVSDASETVALPFLRGAARTGVRVDIGGVDAVVNGVARAILGGGARLRRLQTGIVSDYAMAMVAGIIAAVVIFAVAWR